MEAKRVKSPLKISSEKRKWAKVVANSSTNDGPSSSTRRKVNESEARETESPEPNCPICLGKIENKSFAHQCFHSFCKTCLFEWAKVKPECPVCRQPFDKIIFNVKSLSDYEEKTIPPRIANPPSLPGSLLWAHTPVHAMDAPFYSFMGMHAHQFLTHGHEHGLFTSTSSSSTSRPSSQLEQLFSNRRTFSTFNLGINIGVDPINTTFNVRTGGAASAAAGSATSASGQLTSAHPVVQINPSGPVTGMVTLEARSPYRSRPLSRGERSSFSSSLRQYLTGYPSASAASAVPSSHTRQPAVGTSEYRRYIYDHNLWAKYNSSTSKRRSRICTAAFFSSNPAQTHRIISFVNRETNALLASWDAQYLSERIRDILSIADIRSKRFRRIVETFTHRRTDQFIHELYCFASSAHETVEEYDRNTSHVPKADTEVQTTLVSPTSPALPPIGFLYESSDEDDLTWAPGDSPGSESRRRPFCHFSLHRRNRRREPQASNSTMTATTSPQPGSSRSHANVETIEISDDSDDDTVPILESTAGTNGNSSESPTESVVTPDIDVSDPSDELNIDLLDDDVGDVTSVSSSRNTGQALFDQPRVTRSGRTTFPLPAGRLFPEFNHDNLHVGREEAVNSRLQDYVVFPTLEDYERDIFSSSFMSGSRRDAGHRRQEEDDDDSDVEIVGSVKPRHERTPEVIDVNESDEEEEVDVGGNSDTLVNLNETKEEDDTATEENQESRSETLSQETESDESSQKNTMVIECPTTSSTMTEVSEPKNKARLRSVVIMKHRAPQSSISSSD